jgi:hypothetical protein
MDPPALGYDVQCDFFVAIRLVGICHHSCVAFENPQGLRAALSGWSATLPLYDSVSSQRSDSSAPCFLIFAGKTCRNFSRPR